MIYKRPALFRWWSSSNFRDLTAIGTCRIHTPLSRAVGRYPIDLDLRRNYGFVHTSDEALQQVPASFKVKRTSDRTCCRWSSEARTCGPPGTLGAGRSPHRRNQLGETDHERRRQRPDQLHPPPLCGLLRQRTVAAVLEPLAARTSPGPRRIPRAAALLSADVRCDQELLLSLSVEQQTFKAVKKDMAEDPRTARPRKCCS